MHRLVPKSIICLREGYTRQALLADLGAGVTVGIVALPLAMAFAIASGLSPERGIFTAIVAGFLISALGGSRVQIGRPTGAFVVIVYGIVQKHGYEGLALATLMAGVIIVFMGLAGFGSMIKFIPYPVTTGFTSGIALIIFSSQIKDFFGLSMESVPADFVEKWAAYGRHASSFDVRAIAVGAGSIAAPSWPAGAGTDFRRCSRFASRLAAAPSRRDDRLAFRRHPAHSPVPRAPSLELRKDSDSDS